MAEDLKGELGCPGTERSDETTGQRVAWERGETSFDNLEVIIGMDRTMKVGHGLSMRVQLRNKNKGPRPLQQLKFDFVNEDQTLFANTLTRSVALLQSNQASAYPLLPIQMEPQRPGERNLFIHAQIGDRGDGSPIALQSFIVLKIGEESKSGGERHYHINVHGPQVTIDKKVGDARMIGNDERLDASVRPEIRIQEADLTNQAKDGPTDLIQFAIPFWLDYERTEALLAARRTEQHRARRVEWIEQPPSRPVSPEREQRALNGAYVLEASLPNHPSNWEHRFILLMRPELTVGRGRGNGYILRFAPYGDPQKDPASITISQELGVFQFAGGRLAWRFLKPRNPACPACIAGRMVTDTDPVELVEDGDLELVPGMKLRLRIKRLTPERLKECAAYRDDFERNRSALFAPTQPADFGLAAQHPLTNLNLCRTSDPNGESLTWLFRAAWIGRSPGNNLCIPSDGVELIHARLLYHEGKLALEAADAAGETWIEGRKLERGELALLKPGNVLRIGAARLKFMPYDPEEYLNRAKIAYRRKSAEAAAP